MGLDYFISGRPLPDGHGSEWALPRRAREQAFSREVWNAACSGWVSIISLAEDRSLTVTAQNGPCRGARVSKRIAREFWTAACSGWVSIISLAEDRSLTVTAQNGHFRGARVSKRLAESFGTPP